MPTKIEQGDATRKLLLDTALRVIRTKGYSATSIDDLCQSAGLTKGAFFHHFANKEALAIAAADHFAQMAARLFAGAPYLSIEDPLARFLAYLDFRMQIIRGEFPEFTCLLGTMVQETYQTAPAIRNACERAISAHCESLAKDIAAARRLYVPDASWKAIDLAEHTQAVIQGAFILAKAKQDPRVAIESVRHLKRYVMLLFGRPDSSSMYGTVRVIRRRSA